MAVINPMKKNRSGVRGLDRLRSGQGRLFEEVTLQRRPELRD